MCSFQATTNCQATLVGIFVATSLFAVVLYFSISPNLAMAKEPKEVQKAYNSKLKMAQTYMDDSGEASLSGANDVLVVRQDDGRLKSTP